MPGRRLIPLACPHAGQAVGSFGLPSCRAHAFMRVGTPTFVTRRKGGKGVPKGEENRSERFSEGNLLPFLLWNPSSFDRSRFASVAEAPVAYVFDGVKALPATLAWLLFEALTAHEPVLEFDCVRFLAVDALGASARRPNRGYATGRCPGADLPPAARREF